MNTIYRSIWNEALSSWVAVPEWAAACGKASRSGARRSLKRGLGALSMGFVLSAVSQAVLAACPADSVNGVAVSTGETCSAGLSSYVGTLSAVNGGRVLNVTSSPTLQGQVALPSTLLPYLAWRRWHRRTRCPSANQVPLVWQCLPPIRVPSI